MPNTQILAALVQKPLLKFSAGKAESRPDMLRKGETRGAGREEGRERAGRSWAHGPARLPQSCAQPAVNDQVLFIAPLMEPSA